MYPTHDPPTVESWHSQGPQQAAEEMKGEEGLSGPHGLSTESSRRGWGPFRVPGYMK